MIHENYQRCHMVVIKDGLKIWIESKDLELKKFTDKAYNIRYDRLYKERVGEWEN